MKLCNVLAILHLRCSQKLLLQNLSSRLDACKRDNSSLLLVVAQFLSRIYLRVKRIFFSGRMTVIIKRASAMKLSVSVTSFVV